MKRIDRLVIKELVGPWLFGVLIFSALVIASTMLNRLAEWIAKGIEPGTALQVVFLLVPGIVVKTFAMAMLLAGLLAFGRLSNDSEVVALRAAGASLFRIMRPVLIFGAVVAAISFSVNEFMVPWASRQAQAVQLDIRKQLSKTKEGKEVFQNIKQKDGGVAQIMARDFDLQDGLLSGVTISQFNKEGERTFMLAADQMRYGGEGDWEIIGKSSLFSADGALVVSLSDGAWPKQIDRPKFTPTNLLAGFATDLDVFSMAEIKREIAQKEQDPVANKRIINNLKFGYYNKFALPLAAVVFALLGAPLGIRSHRTGMGAGFALAVVLSFFYLMLVNFLAVYSNKGIFDAWIASFAPVIVGAIGAAIAIYRKNG